jgi:hypothetical protein
MAEEQGFLGRWSARKRAVREAEAEVKVEAALAPETAAPIAAEPEPEPEIDPADLPPLDSIRSGMDVQAFLQRGVPKALRQAALRRLWSVDPKIRAFREVADYDWDFNAPGYGALLPGDDPKAVAEKLFQAMRRQVAERVQGPGSSPPARASADGAEAADAPPPAVAAPSATPVTATSARAPVDHASVEPETERAPRRRHGKAIPQ